MGDAQQAAELEDVEEGDHHGKGPAKDDQDPHHIGGQHIGIVTHPPAPVPLAAIRGGACIIRLLSDYRDVHIAQEESERPV